ncbi:hypothetical protein K461DRAFT_289264 [Myriangium duriaei CBS 260.36]|uniref:Xylanolytic transcriptional activator regulatory domain-containing protein n=1 Tax=Myriangium duriaei CBS 260.36 TaxID=1168546 RepID=A0A9P4J7P9_9PEZI|nr:hypothetical protein K461DRAFT_289264 [Myriangium duriaei CBS 260.36]
MYCKLLHGSASLSHSTQIGCGYTTSGRFVAIVARHVHIVELLHLRSQEHKDRVNVTKQYETKIDRIESRLANIEKLLQQSATTGSSSSTRETPSDSILDHFEDAYSVQAPDDNDLGFRAESTAAKNVFEQAVSRDAAVQQDVPLRRSLDALRGMVDRVHLDIEGSLKDPNAVSTTGSTSTPPPPTWPQVKPLLERFAKKGLSAFNWLSPATFDDFCRLSRVVYEHGQDVLPHERLLVYSLLCNICTELSGVDHGKAADYAHNLARTFSYLLLQALDALPILTPPSLPAVEALLTAAATTIGLCKPSLAWTLCSTAARMCQTLGYNRLAHNDSVSDPLFQRKVMVFWSIYVLDRNTSLRLGRAPALQDYDIDTPMLTSDKLYPSEVVTMVSFWVGCAGIQGKMCAQLYGPLASSLTWDERACTAERLADELKHLHHEMDKSMRNCPLPNREKSTSAEELLIQGQNIMVCSTLTTALYAIPSGHPRRSRALQAARKCLRMSRQISNTYEGNVYSWTVYCHWMLLHTPLTPFTGVFCNIIAHPRTSGEDLQLLKDFVASLEPGRRVSEGIEQFYQLCSIFVHIAQAYVNIKVQQYSKVAADAVDVASSQDLEPTINDFEEHLTALGLFGLPNTSNDLQDVELDQFSDKANLLDWYSGNASLYALLEQDLNELNDFKHGT